MSGYTRLKKGIERIIDANINRSKEGLRVCEDIGRFIFNDKTLARRLKAARHAIDALGGKLAGLKVRLAARNSLDDVGYNAQTNELNRSNLRDVYFANIQRAKESLRVLEELAKLKNRNIALGFKKIRYALYQLEKRFASVFKR